MSVIPTDAAILRAVTLILIPLKSIPAMWWLGVELKALMDTNSWTSPLSLFSNLWEVVASLWTSIGVWLAIWSYFPVDLFIVIESLFWPDTNKTTDVTTIWFIRIASWMITGYSALQALTYAITAIVVDIQTGPLTEVMKKTVVKVVTSLLALAPAITYFFEVNAYSNYL